jgi:serine/threonine protein kinase
LRQFWISGLLSRALLWASNDATNSAGLSRSATKAGSILGTAAYMAPEQASGTLVDWRADIWAFGAVLFEMVTGKAAFPGRSVSEVLAGVFGAELAV